jgi:hypothetical protein
MLPAQGGEFFVFSSVKCEKGWAGAPPNTYPVFLPRNLLPILWEKILARSTVALDWQAQFPDSTMVGEMV